MEPAEKLLAWVKERHAGQKIKLTNEPYINHLLNVAVMAAPAAHLGYEIGLCHDLFEETPVAGDDLLMALESFGYAKKEATAIVSAVKELTDMFTADAYPDMTKHERKENEADRLLNARPEVQTVKYCDLLDNIQWMMRYDRKHAKKYLERKKSLLGSLTKGDPATWRKAMVVIEHHLTQMNSGEA
ncbi:hypothetical protein [Hufsiella ginkgonis]|uniref:HD domain-containing protein n=1 Tax=Hufsiella ginkgonis TaxID=2695274 RepID=A0A7K1Y359_9SPHI|nr:hypothetical protein [Hufsiella ginkgonis]MXV17733.1 hypothetical protein [Hufsiella ginkgonis]